MDDRRAAEEQEPVTELDSGTAPRPAAAGAGAAAADDVDAPVVDTAAPTPAGDLRRVLRVSAEVALVAAVLGLVVGLLWSAVAPDVVLQVIDEGAFLDEVQGYRVIGRDGTFALLAAAAGVVTGVVGWLRHRDEPVPLVVGVALAGAVGTAVAWSVGTRVGPDDVPARLTGSSDGDTLVAPLTVEARGVLVVWSIVAVGAVFLLALVQRGPRRPPTHSRTR